MTLLICGIASGFYFISTGRIIIGIIAIIAGLLCGIQESNK